MLYDDGNEEVELAKEHPNKFVIAQPRVNGDVPNREGLCRPLVWMSLMRRWVFSDWLHTGETSWKPFILGKLVKEKASGTDRTDLETIVRRLTTDFRAVANDAMEIDIRWPEGSNGGRSTHAELCTALANEMSKAVLGQTETTQASTSSGYAQAKVHDAVRRDLRETRARYIASVITRDLIAPMIRLNFGDSVEVPRFEFTTQDPIDLKAFAEGIDKLVGAGAKIPVAWVNEQSGIPEAKDGEDILVPPTKPADAKKPEENDDDKAPPNAGGKPPPTDPDTPDAVEDGAAKAE